MSQEPIKLFISYKTGEATGLTFQARSIKKELETRKDANYHVFLDKDSLKAGLDWNQQIYWNIPRSDILLLLLAPETAASDWVRREVDVAKGAQVTILPVLIRDFEALQDALDDFDLPRLQAVRLFEGSNEEYEKLFDAIDALRDETGMAQKKLLEEADRGPRSHPFPDTQPDYRVYSPKANSNVEVHLAAGSIMNMKPIDVFVNSENDFMQMARAFDDRTISSMLRFNGSYFDGANRLLEDTVQDELTRQVVQHYTTRPLGMGTVVVTKAGHTRSRLVTHNKARYIFHTAVVSVQDDKDGTGKELGTINDQGLMNAVRRTLESFDEVNENRGVISHKNAKERKAEEKDRQQYNPIKSIIFPLLGTGRGGLTPNKVATLMARAIHGYVKDKPETTLEKIYICAYTEETAAVVEEALEHQFMSYEDDEAATEG